MQMAIPVRYVFSGVSFGISLGVSRSRRRAACSIALIAIALSGCSINLGSLTPSADHEEPARLTSSVNVASSNNVASLTESIKNNPNDPQA
jgi:hypothetical protein